MTDNDKSLGLIEGRCYVHEDYPKWGHGVFFIDKTGSLKIDFSQAGIKSVLSRASAGKLRILPTRFKYFNKPARLADGQLVVLMGGKVGSTGDEVYTVFRDSEPRIAHVTEEMTPVEVKNQAVYSLMNDFFRFKKNLPSNTNGIRMASSRSRRITHCYNCKESGLDNSTDFECVSCNWIICPVCGACGCCRGHKAISFSDLFGM